MHHLLKRGGSGLGAEMTGMSCQNRQSQRETEKQQGRGSSSRAMDEPVRQSASQKPCRASG